VRRIGAHRGDGNQLGELSTKLLVRLHQRRRV
jgi:hypothetical protein